MSPIEKIVLTLSDEEKELHKALIAECLQMEDDLENMYKIDDLKSYFKSLKSLIIKQDQLDKALEEIPIDDIIH